jgi:phosphoglycerate dehydrogenase-like enzyme
MSLNDRYVVGLTRDGYRADGSSIFGDIGLERLDAAGIEHHLLPELTNPIDPASLEGLDAVLSFGHLHFDGAIAKAAPRLKHIARFGAGYDGIDLEGLASAGVVVTNTPTAVRMPLTLATITLLLALAHRLPQNQRVAQSGQWAEGRGRHRGAGVQGRTLGIVGLGGVGGEVARIAQHLGFTLVGTDRPEARPRAEELSVEFLSLLDVARRSDYVVVAAALTPQTRHLIDGAFLMAMKPTAYLINAARGELVEPSAVRSALLEGRLAGAAFDVLDREPPAADDPILTHPDVIVTPHCLCWTEDFTRDVSTSVIESLIDGANGRQPRHTLNPSVFLTGWRGQTPTV